MSTQQNSPSEIWSHLKDCKKVLMTLHASPDGDSLGSSTAMKYALEKNFHSSVKLVSKDPLPEYLKALDISSDVTTEKDICNLGLTSFDAIVCLDSARIGMLTSKNEQSFAFPKNFTVVNIDHHPTNTLYGTLNLIDSTKSSCAEVLTDIFKAVNLPFDNELAKRLLIGICSDTECFRFVSRDTAALFRNAAFLIEHGVNFTKEIINPLFYSQPFGYKQFQGLVLKNLKINPDKNFGYSIISKDAWKNLGLTDTEIGGAANFISDIRDLNFIFTLVEDENKISGSFRSRKGVDVSRYATKLGGGGHKAAAGFTLPTMPITDAEKKVLAAVKSVDTHASNE